MSRSTRRPPASLTARCRAGLVTLLLLFPGIAAAVDAERADPGWSLDFYAGGDIGCAAIEAALALPDATWRGPSGLSTPSGVAGRTLWLRLSPQAPTAPRKLVLRWEHNATLNDWRDPGQRVISHEPGHAPGFTVVSLPQGRSEPLLMCLVSPTPRAEAFAILTAQELEAAERVVVIWMALLAGVILATCAMALAFFLRLRAPVFAAYGLYSLCLLGYLLKDAGALEQLLPLALQKGVFDYALGSVLVSGAAAAGVRFTVLFTRCDEDWPRMSTWLRRLSLLALLAVIPVLLSLPPFAAGFHVQIAGVVAQNILIAAMIVLIVPLVALSARRGRREARIYLIGWLPLLALLMLAVLVILGLLPANARLSPLWGMGAAAFASLVLGWGLVDRARRDRIERDLAVERAGRDPLTGACSRGALRPLLEAAGAPAVLLYLDIDHFKPINDRHGHAIGDRCLQRFTQRCQAQLRGVDVFARQGGEEFLALLPDTALEEGLRVAERIRVAVANDDEPSFTVSIGVAQRQPGETVHDWIARADAALYQAKEAGRDRVVAG